MRRLHASELRRKCDPGQFDFETTDEIAAGETDAVSGVGQERAKEAFRVGTGITSDGYNLFVMGPPGTGKHSFVFRALRDKARHQPVPPDLCYVNNFAQPHKPRAMVLPSGSGARLKADIERLIEDLKSAITAAFESEEYRGSKRAIEEEIKSRHDVSFRELQKRAEERGVKLVRTPEGLVFAPYREGKIVTADDFKSMPEERREQIQQDASAFHDLLHGFLQNIPDWEKSGRERIKELDHSVARATVERLMAPIFAHYGQIDSALEFLRGVREDVIINFSEFLGPQEPGSAGAMNVLTLLAGTAGAGGASGRESAYRKYRVNLLVENDSGAGAPVIYEDNPTYQNLVGRIEHLAQMGALVTDFNLIKPGALHRASGGYLVLDAYKLFLQPFAWEGLKRALRSHEIRIESPGQLVPAIATVSLEPEPLPHAPQVVLIGERFLYYMLNHLDPDFPELFKVPVDFEEQLPRTLETSASYAILIASIARKNDLRPLTKDAVARVIDEGARMSGDSEKLTTRIEWVTDLLREANFWAGERRHDAIGIGDIQHAIESQTRRNARLRDRLLEETQRGTVLIETGGRMSGCVNGLAYVDQGNFSFGHPTRITARVRIGRGDLLDIERETKLGGPVHSKGVMILSGFLGSRYARQVPLSFAATLVFEQSYGMVEGDSASLAELYALLSAISDVPLDQSFAVTGAVNQHGQAEAIGGVNEKIEGFFDLCSVRGLTGHQGVLIPEANVKHLMLRRDVVEAVQSGAFQVVAIGHVDDGLEILTGLSAAEVNRRVEARLIDFAERRRTFAAGMNDSRAA